MTVEQIREVWAHVTHNPLATVTGMAEQTGMSRARVHNILHFLEAAGYMRHEAGCVGRTVLIPLMDAKLDREKEGSNVQAKI
jgi:DNA-binding MarR family transcriptional regulator